MSFVDQNNVFDVVEKLMTNVFKKFSSTDKETIYFSAFSDMMNISNLRYI